MIDNLIEFECARDIPFARKPVTPVIRIVLSLKYPTTISLIMFDCVSTSTTVDFFLVIKNWFLDGMYFSCKRPMNSTKPIRIYREEYQFECTVSELSCCRPVFLLCDIYTNWLLVGCCIVLLYINWLLIGRGMLSNLSLRKKKGTDV